MICKKCGAQLNENDKFCGVCGTRTDTAAPAENAENLTAGAQIPDSDVERAFAPEAKEAEKEELTPEESAPEKAPDETQIPEAIPEAPVPEAESSASNSREEPQEKASAPDEQRSAPAFAQAPKSSVSQPSAPAQKPKVKEKGVVSIGIVIFCIVVIAILSIICGMLGGLYFGRL